jgi:hypothetical protein
MRQIHQTLLAATDQVVEPPLERACRDQSFELPTGIYVAMGIMFVGFVAVLGLAFTGEMAVSYGVIFAFLGMFFAVPALFPRMARDSSTRALQWQVFRERGINTATGKVSAGSATVLVLALPFLILCFGVTVAAISAVMI